MVVPSWLCVEISVVVPRGAIDLTSSALIFATRSKCGAAVAGASALARVRRAPRFGRGDVLEDRDQPRDVHVERLQLAQRAAPGRHRSPAPCRRSCGRARRSVLPWRRGRSGRSPRGRRSRSSLAPFCAVVITGSPQARASSTTSEQGRNRSAARRNRSTSSRSSTSG